ncbi:MAG: hypothetical protein IJ789_04825 [Bacteroidales bacterium]|nr:hypothetical protein [Bacteroidales bacterium]
MRHLNEPPAYVHAWAQADNYSLALGFLHNGGDILHPETMIFNKQQLDFQQPLSTVTACDLPLHHWLVSWFMRLLGTNQPWVFRLFTLLVVVGGLWALYGVAFIVAQSAWKAMLVALFAATAPSFAYYSASFLPTAPSLACAMGGLLAYCVEVRSAGGKRVALPVAVALLTLATMMRTSMAVLWVAVAAFHLLRIFRGEASLRRAWLPYAVAVILFAAWQLWSAHLRHEYGSLFLGRLMLPRDWEQVQWVWQAVNNGWKYHYFTRAHYWLLIIVVVGALVMAFVGRNKGVKPQRQKLSLWWLLAIWLFGELLFVGAMFVQFHDHDYYFLDSMFLPVVFLFALSLSRLPRVQGSGVAMVVGLILIGASFMMVKDATNMQRTRRTDGLPSLQTAVNYKSANRLLRSCGVDNTDVRLVTLLAYPQNTPACMMNRQCLAVMWAIDSVANYVLSQPFDYVLIEDAAFEEKFEALPDVLGRLQRIGGNDTLSVCRLADSVVNVSCNDFFCHGTSIR